MKKVKMGLIGFGNIGTGLLRNLKNNKEIIKERCGCEIELTKIADKDITTLRNVDYDKNMLTDDIYKVINDPEIKIVIELIGGLEPARTFVAESLKKGKHVVTANKAMLANFGKELFDLAKENNALLLFEGSVGGGIPIIRGLQQGICANNIKSIKGILNGTCNYILTKMTEEGSSFNSVLKEAQEKGFAEPDPTYDIEGYDSAHKIAILASLAFGQEIKYDDVFVNGIAGIQNTEISFAKELGYVIKLLAIAKNHNDEVEVRVHPTLIPQDNMLASVSGVNNGILVEGDMVGETMFYGRGAGQDPTSSAIISDIMAIAQSIVEGGYNKDKRLLNLSDIKKIRPIDELESSYYLRFIVIDRPRVMARISSILGDQNISIECCIQKGRNIGDYVPLILTTHTTKEKAIQDAIKEIGKLDIVKEKPFLLRVEE
jgi:homoserine dehydrogenase